MYERFSELLQNYGVTAYKVSKETGISQSVFSEWKRGKSQPKIDKLQKLADYFKVPIDYFTQDDSIRVEAHNQPIYLDDETRYIIDSLIHVVKNFKQRYANVTFITTCTKINTQFV